MALGDLYLAIARAVDGAALVREALAGRDDLRGAHVLAAGKVARPMFEGFAAAVGDAGPALLVVPAGDEAPVAGARVLASDHPHPTPRSVAAGQAARALVASLGAGDRLVVLLSGGGSSLLAAPAGTLTLDDKRLAVQQVARAGATIGQLNCVRKHLSALKGGQLGLLTRVPTTVLALSDVVGSDPAVIASGPFSPDPTTFAEALALVRPLAGVPPAALHWLERGADGALPETPKPGDARLDHVRYQVLAGPEAVVAAAHRVGADAGFETGTLVTHTEELVGALSVRYGARARAERGAGGGPRLLVGNGEPRLVVTGEGRGGRATHLALMVAREIAGLEGVSFLAAGTDREDGCAGASGAVVDGNTWARADGAGLDPRGALDRCDSARVLGALGALVEGPGRSNLLDVHLLHIAAQV